MLGIIIVLIGFLALGGNLNNITGRVTGTTSATVDNVTTITLTTSSVDFGTVNNGDTDNTTDDSPAPFVVQNDGTVAVNLTIRATDLFDQAANPSANYKYMVADTGEGNCYITAQSITTYTNMPNNTIATAPMFMSNLNYTDSCDSAEIDILITVPGDEQAGVKTSTVTVTGSQA